MEHDKDNGLDAEKLTVHCDFDHALLTFRHEALTNRKIIAVIPLSNNQMAVLLRRQGQSDRA